MRLYKVIRANLDDPDDVEKLQELHRLCFGDSAPMASFDAGAWWLCYHDGNAEPVAFAGITPSLLGPGIAYLKRSGVLPSHRGKGLQRRLIYARERWARRNKFKRIVTDTRSNNPHSANNLIRCGYWLFTPSSPWGFRETWYFEKLL